ncbi:ribosomal RNA-processing protein RRP9 KNAG_0A07760 [Huiozyma naganishii CBS 8797]|uniref:Uncharacterized protein n=1 Tax=Huiozyma naganishii (strain ATCC MYA-139 / BCRC 22969 / CBS 8797 / KCTC 17520 / NBRC 10181 / NCYC 3082 / Yp74L-3) TaxID=1071383 RepID=J7RFW1_HUIN7|nr:hypothetical protein KNAG_0A07760 [Kazachstania naganishii CBS 8797]CCK68428.1 hypothetical protein KNAG_0A07760 [Kazachstania naganishii CBS 8797]
MPKRSREGSSRPAHDKDEEITDPSSNEESGNEGENSIIDHEEEVESDEEFEGENSADKRRRLARQYLDNLKTDAKSIATGLSDSAALEKEQRELDDYNNFDAADLDKDIIATRLKQDVAEQQGRIYRLIGDKLLVTEANVTFTRVGEKCLTGLSCYQPDVNKFHAEEGFGRAKNRGKIFAYTVSGDLQLTKYDVTDFSKRPKKMKHVRGGSKYTPKSTHEFENTTEGHYKEILTVAASPDGKYVVTGGRDRKLIVWSTESLAPVKVIPTKDRRGEILSLAFRNNSDQLYASCADYKIRTYSINQFAQLEILYGHYDSVVDISALAMERCVSVGARDKTAMLWKIPDETRLTFRGGDNPEKLLKKWMKTNAVEKEDGEIEYPDESQAPVFFCEGSIDVVSMVDDSHFVTGSDNGNIHLWSTGKKKPIFTERAGHGYQDAPSESSISGEVDEIVRRTQVQDNKIAHPFWITSIYAVPYSNIFISGSWNGILKVWKISENLREFSLLGELPNCKGVVNRIQVVESGKPGKETFRVLASVSKEHRLGRWINHTPGGRNGIYSAVIEQTTF